MYSTKRKRARLIREHGVPRAVREPDAPRQAERQESGCHRPDATEEDMNFDDTPSGLDWHPDEGPQVERADMGDMAAAQSKDCDSEEVDESSEEDDEADGAGVVGTSTLVGMFQLWR